MGRYKSTDNTVKRHQRKILQNIIYDSRTVECFNKDSRRRETVEDFLARGGIIEKCGYRKPSKYLETFNGQSKYDKVK